jgi:putative FmdB family regulatory protein
MPIYEYRCEGCGQVTEALIRNARETERLRCEHCGDSRLERVYLSPIAPVPTAKTPAAASCCGLEEGCPESGRCRRQAQGIPCPE